ncbi:PepSY-associated TM helix domain-containing protein [Streptomyces daliensis]|uniref:PepSY domain-containing protein n=1 Tax=Streptomyces daliensis TaxID=299421 RepID=A0A8T4IJY4_9ACTN|nr:PepSY domain-containing protein [Streptomyces daliensis]
MSVETPDTPETPPHDRPGSGAARAEGTPAPTPSPRAGGWQALRPLVLRLHFCAGLLIAPFLLVAAVTGLLYAASFQIEKAVYADELTVDVPKGGPHGDPARLPLSRQVEAALDAHPDGELTAVRPSSEPEAATRVLLDDPSVADPDNSLAVFVDPYTARVQGALESYGSSGALPVRAWIDHLHRDLHLGEPGRLYSEFAASWLWVVALGGVALWLGRARGQRKLRGTTGARRTLSLHGTVGLWAALGLLVLSATGLSWSAYAGANIEALRTSVGSATPTVSADTDTGEGTGTGHEGHGSGGDHSGHGTHEGHGDAHAGHPAEPEDVGLDRVLTVAREGQGLSGPIEITPSSGPGSAYVVAQTDKQWPHHLDQIAVDPSDGKVVDRLDFKDYPLLAKLTRWGIDGHQGLLFGLANQVLLMALAGALITLIVLGYRMWWHHCVPPQRGAWRRVPLPTLLPLVAVAAVVGWFLPLFGIGLVAFLTVDAVLGVRARRRARTARTARTD